MTYAKKVVHKQLYECTIVCFNHVSRAGEHSIIQENDKEIIISHTTIIQF